MKNQILNYYENTIIYYGNYHNHKEISAWAGLVLQILITTFIIQSDSCLYDSIAYMVFSLIITISLNMYVKSQHDLKDLAASYVAASNELLSEIALTDKTDLRSYLAIDDSNNIIYQAPNALPKILIDKAEKYNLRYSKSSRMTRILVLLLLNFCIFIVVFLKILKLIATLPN